MPLTPGARLGRYELLDVLGRGGTAEVWHAVLHGPQGFRKHVALKVLTRTEGDGASVLAHEARLGALLSHPNVVATLDLGETGGQLWIAMELVRGATVAELVRCDGTTGRAVLEVGLQSCAALAHVHGLEVDGRPAGLVHRDVKPSNLLIDLNGTVKLADLGIATLASTVGDACGTPGYMPLEQHRGRADARSDVFALGMTLVALACRKRLLRRGQELDDLRELDGLTAGVWFRDTLEARVPGLAPVLRRCLRRDPDQRFPSAAALAEALQALRPLQAPGPSVRELLGTLRPDLKQAPSDHSSSRSTVLVARGNLPRQNDRFLGRDAEIASLVHTMRGGARLVTLLGPGGAGKTRLSIEVGRRLVHELPGGAWFVDLSEARTPVACAAVVARLLGVPLERGDDPIERVGQALAGRERALVVLDNFEQLAAAAADTVGRWVAAAPNIGFLVTSRVALRLSGEERFLLGPLSLVEGVALFLERAPRPLAEDERAGLDELVAGLEGSPLAIELAAARVRFVRVDGIRDRLVDRLRLLAGGAADRPERQRSLRASLDGSFELLSDWGRGALAQLSVFEGGFTLEAAEAVLDLRVWPEAPWPLDVLELLSDASLVRLDQGRRFRLLLAVQVYAAEQLPAADRLAAERRHGAFFAQSGTPAALDLLQRAGGAAALDRRVEDLDNLRVALSRAVAERDPVRAVPLARAAVTVLRLRGPFEEASTVLEAVLPLVGTGPGSFPLRVAAAGLARERGDPARALRELEGLLAEVDAGQPSVEVLRVLFELGMAWQDQSRRDETLAVWFRALAIARDLGDGLAEAQILSNLGAVELEGGATDSATARFEAALACQRLYGNERMVGVTLANLGVLELARGDPRAEATLREAVQLLRIAGDRRVALLTQGNLGCWLLDHGDLLGGEALLDECLEGFREIGAPRQVGTVLGQLGALHLRAGRVEEGERRLREALAVASAWNNPRTECAVLGNLGYALLLSGRLDEAREATQRARARALEFGSHRFLTLTTETLAQIALAAGDLDEADRCMASAAETCPAELQECVGMVAFGTALVREAQGRPVEARELAEQAVAALDRSNVLEAGRAWVLLARLARAAGDRASMARALEHARAAAGPFGATSLLAVELRAVDDLQRPADRPK